MNIIYFGSDAFGIPSLEELKKRYNLLCVVTAPDKPSGRGMKLTSTPIKRWALTNNVIVYQPEDLSDTNFLQIIKNISPELLVLISYGKVLPETIIKIPSISAINVHPSLLPEYRGAAPMEWALIDGKQETGISVITIKNKIDTGDIIKQMKVPIHQTDDIFSLRERISKDIPSILIESIEDIKKGIEPIPQEGIPTYARRLKKEDGLIRWKKTATQIYNLIRGVKEWPGAYTYLGGKYIKIYSAIPLPEETNGKPGEIVKIDKHSIYVACGKGILRIEEIQMEGKKRMPVSEFLNGYHLKIGTIFS